MSFDTGPHLSRPHIHTRSQIHTRGHDQHPTNTSGGSQPRSGTFQSRRGDLVIPLVWIAADIVSAWLLFRICHARELATWSRQTYLFAWDQSRALKVAAMFLINPYSIVSCISRSTISLEIVALLATIQSAIQVRPCPSLSTAGSVLSAFALSSAAFPMLVQLCRHRAGEIVYEREIARLGRHASATDTKAVRRLGFLADRVRFAKRFAVFKCLILMPAALAGGLWLSRAIVLSPGGASFGAVLLDLPSILEVPSRTGMGMAGASLRLRHLRHRPHTNLGLWWYFFMEIFDHFRDFFLLTFNVHLASYVLPFSIKYRQDPLFGITAMVGVIAGVQELSDLGRSRSLLGATEPA